MRQNNPKVDPESPAAKIAAKFDRRGNPRASGLANALGKTPSTVQRWLEKGFIPAENHGEVVTAARSSKITIKPEDFVDARAFEKVKAEASA
jgi:hypothetical protein